MRALALIGLLALASCGDDSAENKAAAVAATLSPGQWELSSQVTRFTKTDQGAPRINTPVGTRATQSLCIAPGDRLPTALFSGDEYSCTYDNYYVRNGIANATLTCQRQGLSGSILMTVSGSFGADNVRLHRSLRSILTTDGDVLIEADVTGRRTGAAWPPAPAGGAQNRQ